MMDSLVQLNVAISHVLGLTYADVVADLCERASKPDASVAYQDGLRKLELLDGSENVQTMCDAIVNAHPDIESLPKVKL